MDNIKTSDLINCLMIAIKENNQQLINMYAYKLTTRLYVPNTQYTFEETLEGFGYKILKENPKQISIEEYMRKRKQN